jgi:uncharacterized membrane protein
LAAGEAGTASAPPSSLAEVLRRERESDISRIIGLSDGIFGFAITLLVINLVVPTPPNGVDFHGERELAMALFTQPFAFHFLAYLLSFGVIAVSWSTHRRVFLHIRTADGWLIRFNLIFLFFIAITPFFADLLSEASDVPLAVQLYALDQVGVGASLAGVWYHAARRGHIAADADPSWHRFLNFALLVRPALFAASIGLAVFSVTLAYLTWSGIFFALAFARRRPVSPAAAAPRNALRP